jgi:hypothetical protein
MDSSLIDEIERISQEKETQLNLLSSVPGEKLPYFARGSFAKHRAAKFAPTKLLVQKLAAIFDEGARKNSRKSSPEDALNQLAFMLNENNSLLFREAELPTVKYIKGFFSARNRDFKKVAATSSSTSSLFDCHSAAVSVSDDDSERDNDVSDEDDQKKIEARY